MSAPNLRARKAPQPPSAADNIPAPVVIDPPPRRPSKPASNWPSALDILRVLGGLLLLSSALSYFITRDSILWGYRPAWTRPARIKAFLTGPLHLTDSQLTLYNGTDPSLPILLALNGSIYDVSASPHMYGPGGSYAFFAGRDATRAFVTGCFDTDLNGDLRGVEEMFMPVDDDDNSDNNHDSSHKGEGGTAAAKVGGGDGGEKERVDKRERKIRREREKRAAKQQVRDVVDGWRKLFDGGKGGKYFKRGEVDRSEGSGWQGWGEVKELCEKARQGRPRRTAAGDPVG